jgi:hypothetical protein
MKTFEVWCWLILFALLSYFVIKLILIYRSSNEEDDLDLQTNKFDNV